MKILLSVCLIVFAVVFQVVCQSQPEGSVLKWSLERDKVAESWLSPNGEFVLVISDVNGSLFSYGANSRSKGEVEFIETATGKTVSKLSVCNGSKFGFNSFSFERSLWAVTCENGKVELWNPGESRLLKDFYPAKGKEIDYLELSPDGKRLLTFEQISIGEYAAVLWDTGNGKIINHLRPNFTKGSIGANAQAEFSKDSKMVAVSYNADVYLWDARNGNQIVKLVDPSLGNLNSSHKSLSYTMRFSPGGEKLVTGSADTLFKIWDTATGELLKTLKGHKSRDGGAVFSSDAKLIATSDRDGNVKLWRANTGELIWSVKSKADFRLKFSKDQKRIYATSYNMRPAFLDVKTGKVLWNDKNWWQTDKELRHLVMFDKKSKLLKLFEFNY